MRSVLVLPTYNESENIEPFLRAVREASPDTDIVVVDDNSPDGTGLVADRLAEELGRIDVLHRPGKAGLGSAYRAGFNEVLGGSYDIVISMDADFSHDPNLIPDFVQLITDGADIVIGSRYVTGGGTTDWPVRRQLLSRWGNAYTRSILGVAARDCTSGYRAYRATSLAKIDPTSTSAEGYAFLTELVRRMTREGASVVETPIIFRDRTRGQVQDVGTDHRRVDAAGDPLGHGRPIQAARRPQLTVDSFAARARRFAGSSAGLIVLVTVGLAVPLLVAVIALAQRRWYPVLDLAMTEFRIRDVGSRQTPLIGLPGRIGEFPDQGSHPGPFNFWLLAPGYRLFGSSAWAMEASTALVQTLWIGLALWIGHRRAGRSGAIVVALVVALLVRGYGLSVLTQPWNPYLPLIAWVVILLATWSVVAGDHAMLIPLAVAASFAAQTHIPYLVMAGGLGAGAAVLVAVRWARQRRADVAGDVADGPPRALLITAAVFASLSLPPLVDQIRRTPGNITRLLDHFGHPPEEAIGFVHGFDLLLQHLNVFRAAGTMFTGTGGFVDLGQLNGATWIPGALVLSMWVSRSSAPVNWLPVNWLLAQTCGHCSISTW